MNGKVIEDSRITEFTAMDYNKVQAVVSIIRNLKASLTNEQQELLASCNNDNTEYRGYIEFEGVDSDSSEAYELTQQLNAGLIYPAIRAV